MPLTSNLNSENSLFDRIYRENKRNIDNQPTTINSWNLICPLENVQRHTKRLAQISIHSWKEYHRVVLELLVHIVLTAYIPVSEEILICTFRYDTVLMLTDGFQSKTVEKLQDVLD